MDIRFSGKNITVTGGMREHLSAKLLKLDKYAPRIVESHAILKKEKYQFVAEITLLAKNLKAYGEGTSKENVFTAMDQAYSRIEKQLKRFREKVKDHKHNLIPKSSRFEAEAETPASKGSSPRLMRTAGLTSPEPLFPEDASMQLQVSRKPLLVFKNADSGKVNVVFIRQDGNHGLVEPDFK